MDELTKRLLDARSSMETKIRDLTEELRQKTLQNDELKKLLVRVYACHQPDVCDCDTPADGPHSDSCISTRVAEVSLRALTEKRNSEPDPFIACTACGAPKLCPCGHPVAMHRPKCFWVGLCGCQTKLPPDLVARAVETDKRDYETERLIAEERRLGAEVRCDCGVPGCNKLYDHRK